MAAGIEGDGRKRHRKKKKKKKKHQKASKSHKAALRDVASGIAYQNATPRAQRRAIVA